MNYSNLYNELSDLFFGPVILAMVEIAAIIGIIRSEKFREESKWFLIYILLDLILVLVDNIVYFPGIKLPFSINFFFASTNIIISITELTVYYYYFSKILKNKRFIKVSKIIPIVYCLISLPIILIQINKENDKLIYFENYLNCLELLLLIIPCTIYYLQLFKVESSFPLFSRPSFWLSTGIFFYAVISIPFYSFYMTVYSISVSNKPLLIALFYYLPFIINIIFITKAFTCKHQLTI